MLGSLPFRVKSGFARSVTVQVPYAHVSFIFKLREVACILISCSTNLNIWANNFKCRLELNYLEIAFTPNGTDLSFAPFSSMLTSRKDRILSPDNPSSKLVSSLLKDLDKSKLESESVSWIDSYFFE